VGAAPDHIVHWAKSVTKSFVLKNAMQGPSGFGWHFFGKKPPFFGRFVPQFGLSTPPETSFLPENFTKSGQKR
jgi:hypothetical protein